MVNINIGQSGGLGRVTANRTTHSKSIGRIQEEKQVALSQSTMTSDVNASLRRVEESNVC